MFEFSPIINKAEFLNIIDHDVTLMETIITMFKEQYETSMHGMEEALRTNNVEAFERAAHDLKNIGRNVASEKLINHSRELENFAAENNLARAKKMIGETERLLNKALKELLKIQKSIALS